MRPETKAALLDELAIRGVHLDPKVEPKDATMKDVVTAIKKVADRKKIHTERIFEDVKLGDDDNDDCDCTGEKERKEDNCCRVFGRLVWLAILTALGVAMILVGADNKDNCPAEKMVPIFLIVDGSAIVADVFLQLVGSLMMCRAMCRNKSVKKTFLYTAPVRFLRGLLSLFMFVWFIVGSVYVFKIFEPNYDSTIDADVSSLTDYCHEPTYKFAFSVLILGYIMIALMIVLTVCGCCVASCCACALAAGTLAGGIAGGLTGGLASTMNHKGGCDLSNCTEEEEEPSKKLEAIEVA